MYTDISEEGVSKCISAQPNVIIAEEDTHKKLSTILNFDYIRITISQTNQAS